MILGHVQMTYENGKYKKLGEFTGVQLLGLPVIAPNAVYPVVYTLPLMTISMMKGTGVVTSVPSDAPDDYAALRDLQQKPKVRAWCIVLWRFHLFEEMTCCWKWFNV